MHEIREGEEEENVSTTRRRRGIGEGRDLGREGEEVTCKGEDSKYRSLERVRGRQRERERGIKEKDRINKDRISLRRKTDTR